MVRLATFDDPLLERDVEAKDRMVRTTIMETVIRSLTFLFFFGDRFKVFRASLLTPI